ncbi:MAG: hypothetical protein M3252_04160 [Actinomycetota bacterium]|nr:hypothetical protein [Actinomycetota bacterium]
MPPAHALDVLVVGVLSVVKKEVCPSSDLVPRNRAHFASKLVASSHGLMIGEVGERATVFLAAVSERGALMGHELGEDPSGTDVPGLSWGVVKVDS